MEQPVNSPAAHSSQTPAAISYAMPGLSRQAFESTRGIAKAVVVLFHIMIGTKVLSIASSYMQVQLLERMDGGEAVGVDEIESNDVRQSFVVGIYAITFIALAGTYLIWLRRSYRNQSALGAEGLKYSPGWAMGYWFIPIVNLFRPYQVTQEIYQTSDPTAGGRKWSYLPVSSLVGWWWALWIFTTLATRVASRMARGKLTIRQYINASWFDMIGGVLVIATAVLALKVVQLLTERQMTKFASQQLGVPLAQVPVASDQV